MPIKTGISLWGKNKERRWDNTFQMEFNLKILNKDVTAIQIRENVVVTNNIFPSKIGMGENMTHL